MVTYMIATPEKERSLGGLLLNGAIGAATGAIGAGIGMVAAPIVRAAARAAGAAIAKMVVGTAARKAVGVAASGISIAVRTAGTAKPGTLLGTLQGMGVVGKVWASNRAIAASLQGEPAPANATVRDLLDIAPGNPAVPWKTPATRARDDDELLNSVFSPNDGIYMSTRPGRMVLQEGNHRRFELIRRASDPSNDKITWNTPIFINYVK